jgi:hypothetical protein
MLRIDIYFALSGLKNRDMSTNPALARVKTRGQGLG